MRSRRARAWIAVAATLVGFVAHPAPGGEDAPIDASGDPLPRGAIARLGTRRDRVPGTITALAPCPEAGGLLVGEDLGDDRRPAGTPATVGGAVSLVDPATSRTLRRWTIASGGVRMVAVRPATTTALVATDGGALYLLDAVTDAAPVAAGTTVSPAAAAAWTADGRPLVLLEDGAVVGPVPGGAPNEVVEADADRIALADDGSATVRQTETENDEGDDVPLLIVEDLAGRELWRVAGEFAEDAEVVVLAPGAARIAACDGSGRVTLVAKGGAPRTLLGLTYAANAMRFGGPGGASRLAVASDDGELRVWDTATGAEISSLRLPEAGLGAVAFSGDAAIAASFGRIVRAAETPRATAPRRRIALSADGTLAATVGDDALAATLWDVATARARLLPRRHAEPISSIAVSARGDRVLTADFSGGVQLWDGPSASRLPGVRDVTLTAQSAAWCGTADTFLVGGTYGNVFLFAAADARPTGFFADDADTGDETHVAAVAAAPDGSRVAFACGDKDTHRLIVQRYADGATLVAVDLVDGARAVTFSARGGRIAHLDAAGALVLRDTATLAGVARSAGPWTAAACVSGGAAIAVGDARGRVALLRMSDLAEFASIGDAHDAAVSWIAAAPGGSRFATASADGTAVVFDLAAFAPLPTDGDADLAPLPTAPPPAAAAELPVANVEGLRAGESVHAYEGLLPGATLPDEDAMLVVDGRTGLPLAGADVREHAEEDGEPAGRLIRRAATDGFGIVRFHRGSKRYAEQWVVEAPGLETISQYGWGELPREVVLLPADDATFRLLDAHGRPAAGAEVEHLLGCGHSPAIRRVTTDDRGDFTLRAAGREPGGSLWPVAEGIESDYRSPGAALALDGGALGLILAPGRTFEGRVIDEDGAPVAGCRIHVLGAQRGPFGTTDADGRFRITGCPFGADAYVRGPEPGMRRLGGIDLGGDVLRPVVLVVPPAGREFEDRGRALTVPFRVALFADGAPVDGPRATLVRPADGEIRNGEPEVDTNVVRFDAPEGEWLLVPGGPFASCTGDDTPVSVRRDQAAPMRIDVRLQPRLAIEGDIPEGADLVVVAGGRVRAVERGADGSIDDDGDPVHVPATGLVSFQVVLDDFAARVFAAGPVADGVRRVRVDWPAPRRVRFEGGAARGKDVDADAPIRKHWEDDTLVLSTHAAGRLRLRLDDVENGRIADVVVELPDAPGGEVTVPSVDWRPREDASVRFVGRDVKPVEDVEIEVRTWTGSGEEPDDVDGERWKDGRAPIDRERTRHVLVVASGAGLVPRPVPVDGPGERVLTWGTATVRLAITADGAPAPKFVLWVDGALVTSSDGDDTDDDDEDETAGADEGRASRVGVATLGGLDDGRHTVLVGVAGRVAQRLELKVGAGETRDVAIDMPAPR